MPTRQADVPWLAEVNRPPKEYPLDFAGKMRPLLEPDGCPSRNRKQWLSYRTALRHSWERFLGPMPKAPRGEYSVLRTETLNGFIRERIRYECEAGLFVEAYLLKPAAQSKPQSRAGIVALHQTTNDTIEEIAGVTGMEFQHLGLKLARRGFVVICPRNFLWENTPSYKEAVDRFRKRHPKALGMRKMLYDAARAVDILATVDEVDPQRIGAIGHSLGAKEVLYLAAFDERIKAAVASEGGVTFRSTNWNAPWYLGKAIDERDFPRNHHELLALAAPRPFMILAGESGRGAADGDRSWPLVAAAQEVYRLWPGPVRLGILNHGKGHSIPDGVFDRSVEWFEVYLRSPNDGEQHDERPN